MLNVEQGYYIYKRQWIVYFLAVDAPRYKIVLGYGYCWSVWVLSNTTVQVQCLRVAWIELLLASNSI